MSHVVQKFYKTDASTAQSWPILAVHFYCRRILQNLENERVGYLSLHVGDEAISLLFGQANASTLTVPVQLENNQQVHWRA